MTRRNGWLAPGSWGRETLAAIPGALLLLLMLLVQTIGAALGTFNGGIDTKDDSLTPSATLLGWTLIIAFLLAVIVMVIWVWHG
ncbi:MAG: hypothetical protein ACYDBB_23160 [Armatimonadota bacterium]